MNRTIYGICVDEINVNHDKLIQLMRETPPDFPSDSKSVYSEYIIGCYLSESYASPEEWVVKLTFSVNGITVNGITALLYKNILINNSGKAIYCTTGKDKSVYLGVPIGEPLMAGNDMKYTPLEEIKEILKKYIKKISNDAPNIGWIQYE